jgi:hypothetical protein
MLKEEALKPFDGKVAELADALGITTNAIYMWKDGEPIPEQQALRLKYEILPRLKRPKRRPRVTEHKAAV